METGECLEVDTLFRPFYFIHNTLYDLVCGRVVFGNELSNWCRVTHKKLDLFGQLSLIETFVCDVWEY